MRPPGLPYALVKQHARTAAGPEQINEFGTDQDDAVIVAEFPVMFCDANSSVGHATTLGQYISEKLKSICRRGEPERLLHHPDGITGPMSRSDTVWDNASIGSVFSSLKTKSIEAPRQDHAANFRL